MDSGKTAGADGKISDAIDGHTPQQRSAPIPIESKKKKGGLVFLDEDEPGREWVRVPLGHLAETKEAL